MATDTKVPPYPSGPPTSQPPRRPDSEDEHNRIYRGVSFASTSYVPWVFGRLRLGNADLARLQTSGVPVLRYTTVTLRSVGLPAFRRTRGRVFGKATGNCPRSVPTSSRLSKWTLDF